MLSSARRGLSAIFGRRKGYRWLPDGEASSGLLLPPTREDIRQGYRFILGREPESEAVIALQMQHVSVASFRSASLRSVEFRDQYRGIGVYAADARSPYGSEARPAVAFIHLAKTGGTTLYELLAQHFEQDRICPGPNFPLYCFAVAELAHYDFFAGHYEFDSIRFIPRQNIRTVSLFREPCSRLISLYRFFRTVVPSETAATLASDPLVQLAHELPAEEFFESPRVRADPGIFNNYLLAFGRSPSWFVARRSSPSVQELDAAFQDAERRIRSLTALGITERFDQSARYICSFLGLTPPKVIKPTNVTDEKRNPYARFRPVDPVSMTPRLAAALEGLTAYDRELYRLAVREFDSRCAAPEALRRLPRVTQVENGLS